MLVLGILVQLHHQILDCVNVFEQRVTIAFPKCDFKWNEAFGKILKPCFSACKGNLLHFRIPPQEMQFQNA